MSMVTLKWANWLRGSQPSAMRIGIDGLSALASCLEIGSQYAVFADNSQARMALLRSTVLSAIAGGRSCVIVSNDPEKLHATLQLPVLPNNVSLQLLKRLPDTQANLQQFGVDRFLSELEDVGMRAASLLIVDGADDFFTSQDVEQLEAQILRYRQWLADWQLAGLFLLEAKTDQALYTLFAQQLDWFSGVAEFRKDLGGYRWSHRHWYSDYGVLEATDYEVQNSADGRDLLVIQALSDNTENPGQQRVYFTTEAVDDDESVPDDWLRCLSYLDVVALASELAQATVVLHYRQQTAFPLLAQTVHQLRFLAGRQMRIVIREQGNQLRYSQELLLTRLGANQIVYAEFGISRLLRAVESSMGHRFTGYIEDDFERALTAAMPSEECGYLPPARFCEVVAATLHKTEAIEMHHVLVSLDLLPEKAHLDVLLNCQPRRANDVVTADESHVYIFLFACREPDIDAALRRIIIEPIEQLFDGHSYWSGRGNILDALERLQAKSNLTGLADYSSVLPIAKRHIATAASSNAQPAVLVTHRFPAGGDHGSDDGHCRLPAARTVVKHVVKLRG